jgi:hypothetical protein
VVGCDLGIASHEKSLSAGDARVTKKRIKTGVSASRSKLRRSTPAGAPARAWRAY